MRNLYWIFTAFLCLLCSHPKLNGQQNTRNGQCSITGKLVRNGTDEPLPFATAVLYNQEDSTMASNALTDDDGSFELFTAPGTFYIVFQYIGFREKVLRDLVIDKNRDMLRLGVLGMDSDAIALDEITVKAEKSQMEMKLDRRVFNVGKDLTTRGNSAADILDNVPSVNVDPEGNVSLRGSQSVRILVNGKPSGLLSADDTRALLRMQGDIIESIEVITNPSARYEAEGEAGIINIILKKNREKGVNGSFGLTAGYPHNYGASYNLNYRRKDFNLFSNFGLTYRKTPGGGNDAQRFFNDGMLTEYYTSETDQTRGGLGGYLQVGTDWIMSEQSTLTGSLLYRTGKDRADVEVFFRDFDEFENLQGISKRNVDEEETDHNVEGALNFTRTFDDHDDHKWTIDVKYILNDDTELADYDETSTQSSNVLFQRSSNTEDERNFLFQTDYVHPFGDKSKVEGGLRAALRQVNNDFLVEEQRDNGEYEVLEGFDNRLSYTENIYAAYLIGAHEFGEFALQGGLRMEISDVRPSLENSDEENNQFYTSFFPSIAATYTLTEADQFQLSYSRRLSRPYFRNLLPFSNFNNPRANPVGNPNLLPEFTNSFEAGYLRYFTSGSLLSTIYYRHTTGVIERLILPGEAPGTTIRYPVNLSTRHSMGLEISFSYDLLDWWSINSDVNFFRAIVDGEFEGDNFSSDTYTWTGRLNTKFDFGKNMKIQASYDYNAPERTTQGRRLSSASFDFGVSMDILKGKGTLTLSGRDLFNQRIRRRVISQPGLQSESSFQWRRSQGVVLTFDYRLNQEKTAQAAQQGDFE